MGELLTWEVKDNKDQFICSAPTWHDALARLTRVKNINDFKVEKIRYKAYLVQSERGKFYITFYGNTTLLMKAV